jgi:hypothetical protein
VDREGRLTGGEKCVVVRGERVSRIRSGNCRKRLWNGWGWIGTKLWAKIPDFAEFQSAHKKDDHGWLKRSGIQKKVRSNYLFGFRKAFKNMVPRSKFGIHCRKFRHGR